MKRVGFRIVAIAMMLAGLTGCSSFQREWDRASSSLSGSTGLEGRWEGRWESDRNHHSGALRCLIRRGTNDTYSARFHAKYRRLVNLSFGYTAELQTVSGQHPYDFSGAADLGWYAGGRYEYNGYATGTNFVSTYSSRYDHGKFFMNRVP